MSANDDCEMLSWDEADVLDYEESQIERLQQELQERDTEIKRLTSQITADQQLNEETQKETNEQHEMQMSKLKGEYDIRENETSEAYGKKLSAMEKKLESEMRQKREDLNDFNVCHLSSRLSQNFACSAHIETKRRKSIRNRLIAFSNHCP